MRNPRTETNIRESPEAQAYAAAHAPAVQFDHDWTGKVEQQLRVFLASGLAGPDGLNGQAVVDQMNALGGIYANGAFNPHHNGPEGAPTYGYTCFYVSYVPLTPGGARGYQIVEFEGLLPITDME
jgi:hypothetical protein